MEEGSALGESRKEPRGGDEKNGAECAVRVPAPRRKRGEEKDKSAPGDLQC